jgi:hypothetical protein
MQTLELIAPPLSEDAATLFANVAVLSALHTRLLADLRARLSIAPQPGSGRLRSHSPAAEAAAALRRGGRASREPSLAESAGGSGTATVPASGSLPAELDAPSGASDQAAEAKKKKKKVAKKVRRYARDARSGLVMTVWQPASATAEASEGGSGSRPSSAGRTLRKKKSLKQVVSSSRGWVRAMS